jgi:hypothetical protein
MPAKKKVRATPPAADVPWQVILEEIRSQNRATIEEVVTSRQSLELRIERLERDTSARDAMLEMAVRELRLEFHQLQGDVRGLQGDVKGLQGDVKGLQGDMRSLTSKVDGLVRLEERVSELERHRV